MAELPAPTVLFKRFEYETGTEGGARQRFQQMITDLVGAHIPGANEVAGPGGSDWGIDTYVGQLDESILVWQSKFFLTWRGENERGQVRKSFNEIVKKSAAEGFKVAVWRLCIPCVLPPGEQKWLDNWMRKQRTVTNIQIELWNAIKLRTLLSQDDALAVREAYFPPAPAPERPMAVATVKDTSSLDSALFVRQLKEAGIRESDGAKGLFFAAEALARDIAGRGQQEEMTALLELHLDLLTNWEDKFNEAAPSADSSGRMSTFVTSVLRDAAQTSDPPGITLRPVHRRGITHRLVEDRRAGWVVHWRNIADGHTEPSKIDPQVELTLTQGNLDG